MGTPSMVAMLVMHFGHCPRMQSHHEHSDMLCEGMLR